MWRAMRRIDRLLLHPWTTRVGAVQAIIGAGALAAGLVGGAVTLVFGFSHGWALLAAFGALLLAATGTATLIEAYRDRRTARSDHLGVGESKRELRKATSWVLADLEGMREQMESALATGYWWPPDRLAHHFWRWIEEGETIAVLGYHDEHRNTRLAVRRADELQDDCKAIWAQASPGEYPSLSNGDATEIADAIDALRTAERDLERIQR